MSEQLSTQSEKTQPARIDKALESIRNNKNLTDEQKEQKADELKKRAQEILDTLAAEYGLKTKETTESVEPVDALGAISLDAVTTEPAATDESAEAAEPIADAQEAPETPEAVETEDVAYTEDEAIELLSYVDVEPEADRDMLMDAARNHEVSARYAQELIELSEAHGQGPIYELSDKIRDEYAETMKRLGLTATIYGDSMTWSMWDIAKQSYLAKHPDGSSEEYKLADPLSPENQDEKIHEISDRHIGWEFLEAYKANNAVINMLPSETRGPVMEIVTNGQKNDTGQLRSFEYTKLGELLRTAE